MDKWWEVTVDGQKAWIYHGPEVLAALPGWFREADRLAAANPSFRSLGFTEYGAVEGLDVEFSVVHVHVDGLRWWFVVEGKYVSADILLRADVERVLTSS